ncbi:MAG: hypothetical protein Q4D98_11530 [Planctomycetia bacterium]|nr:hypothetical protein [Planctomycetia bacterium]
MYRASIVSSILLFIAMTVGVVAEPIENRWTPDTQEDVENFYRPFQTSESLKTYFFHYIEGDVLSDKVNAILAYLEDQDFLKERFPEVFTFEMLERVYSAMEAMPLNEDT